MKYLRNWYVRKIRKGGRVKIAGHWYSIPNNEWRLPYDGRLDGLKAVFGMYIDYSTGQYKDTIYYHHTVGFESEEDYKKDPMWVNNHLEWDCWRREYKDHA